MKKIRSLVIVSFLTLFTIQTTSCAQKTFEQCYSSLEKKDFTAAEECFEELAKKNPKDYKARMFLAKTHAYQKKLDRAIDEYKAIIEEAPDTPFAKAARSSVSMLASVKLLVNAKERSQKRTLNDITKGAEKCEKGKNGIVVTCTFPCHGKLVVKKDGTKTMKYSDGESIEEAPNGVVTTIDTTGSKTIGAAGLNMIEDSFRTVCRKEKDETLFVKRNNGTKEYHLKNGDIKMILGSGQKLLFKKNGGIEEIKD